MDTKPLDFVLSDESINDCGFWLPTDGIDLNQFQKNPVMLYAHNWDKVIGKWADIRKEGGKLIATAVFDEKDEEAVKIKNKVEQGMMNATSVGIDMLEFSTDTVWLKQGQTRPTPIKTQIFEASILPFGSNKNALRLRHQGQMTTLGTGGNTDFLNIILPKIPTEATMKALLKKLGLNENATEQEAIAALEKFQLARVSTLIELGKQKGVINDANKAHFEKLATNDYETTYELVNSEQLTKAPETVAPVVPVAPVADKQESLVNVVKELQKANQQTDANDKSKWSFSDWQKKDPKGLMELRKSDFQKYEQLAKAYSGEKI